MKNNELKIVDLHTNFCSQNNVKVLIFKNLTGFFLHKAETRTVASCAYMRSIRLKLTYFDQNLVAKYVHLGFSGLTLISRTLEKNLQLLFKTILRHDAFS